MGWDQSDRTCLLNRETVRITKPPLGTIRKEQIVSLLSFDDVLEQLIGQFGVRPPILGDGRPICPIALVDEGALAVIRLEGDTTGGHFAPPDTAWMREAFRIIREAKAEVQVRVMKSVQRRNTKGGS